jgi:Putative Ig domain/NHL repeat
VALSALAAEGTAVMGGPGDNKRAGAAWVFTRSGTTWTQQGTKLTGSGESGAGEFGDSVAISAEASTAMFGGPGDSTASGAAWVFTRSGTTWTQQGAKLTGAEEVGEGEFGKSVALAPDGATALIGGPADSDDVGGAWVFIRSGSTWTQQGSKLAGKGEVGEGLFGNSTALSSQGATALVGGYGDNNIIGATWVFANSSILAITTASLPSGEPGSGYSQTLTASGGTAPYSWSLSSGSLPAGLHLNGETGAITGTAGTAGTSSFTVKVTDSSSPTPLTATANLSITVAPPTFATSFTHLESREAPFGEPTGVAVDSSGDIWTTDSAHDHVLEFNSKHEFTRQVGQEGSGSGQFKGIGGIAANASGDVYVTDRGNDRVEEYSPTGTLLATFGSSAAGNGQLLSPGAIAIDQSGDVWVLNGVGAQEGGRIVEFSSSGGFLTQFGSKGTAHGQLLYAAGLAISGGHLYVAEFSPQRVQEFSSTGEFIRVFDEAGPGQSADDPFAIAANPSTGELYITELANRVQQFSSEGTLIAAFGSSGAGNGQLSSPEAVAVNSSGTVFVADSGNQRIEEWTP